MLNSVLSEPSLRAMPKAELHCHLLGTVRRDTLLIWPSAPRRR